MSIHKLNSTLTFEWNIDPETVPLVKADFDILLSKPDGSSTYTDDGITTYVAPTATVQGKVTYDLVVSQLGRYQVTLSVGGSAAWVVQALREIFVVDPPSYVFDGVAAKTTQGPEIIPPIPESTFVLWEELTTQPFVGQVVSINYVNDVIFVGGLLGVMAYSADGGDTWTQLTSGVSATINFVSENVYLSGSTIGYSADYLTLPFSLSVTYPGSWQRNIPNSNFTLTTTGANGVYEMSNVSPYAHSRATGIPLGLAEVYEVANQEQGGFQLLNLEDMTSYDASFSNPLVFYTENPITDRIVEAMPSKWADNPVSCWGHLTGKITHYNGTAYHDTITFSLPFTAIAISSYNGVMVACAGIETGYMNVSAIGTSNSWTLADNPDSVSISEIIALDIGHGHAFIGRDSAGTLYHSVDG